MDRDIQKVSVSDDQKPRVLQVLCLAYIEFRSLMHIDPAKQRCGDEYAAAVEFGEAVGLGRSVMERLQGVPHIDIVRLSTLSTRMFRDTSIEISVDNAMLREALTALDRIDISEKKQRRLLQLGAASRLMEELFGFGKNRTTYIKKLCASKASEPHIKCDTNQREQIWAMWCAFEPEIDRASRLIAIASKMGINVASVDDVVADMIEVTGYLPENIAPPQRSTRLASNPDYRLNSKAHLLAYVVRHIADELSNSLLEIHLRNRIESKVEEATLLAASFGLDRESMSAIQDASYMQLKRLATVSTDYLEAIQFDVRMEDSTAHALLDRLESYRRDEAVEMELLMLNAPSSLLAELCGTHATRYTALRRRAGLAKKESVRTPSVPPVRKAKIIQTWDAMGPIENQAQKMLAVAKECEEAVDVINSVVASAKRRRAEESVIEISGTSDLPMVNAAYYEKFRSYFQGDSQKRHIKALSELSKITSSMVFFKEGENERIILSFLMAIFSHYRPEGVCIFEAKQDGMMLNLTSSAGFTMEVIEKALWIPTDSSLTGIAFDSRRIIESTDLYDDRRLNSAIRATLAKAGHRHVVSIPCIIEGDVVGAINMFVKDGDKIPSFELDFMDEVARLVSPVIFGRKSKYYL